MNAKKIVGPNDEAQSPLSEEDTETKEQERLLEALQSSFSAGIDDEEFRETLADVLSLKTPISKKQIEDTLAKKSYGEKMLKLLEERSASRFKLH